MTAALNNRENTAFGNVGAKYELTLPHTELLPLRALILST